MIPPSVDSTSPPFWKGTQRSPRAFAINLPMKGTPTIASATSTTTSSSPQSFVLKRAPSGSKSPWTKHATTFASIQIPIPHWIDRKHPLYYDMGRGASSGNRQLHQPADTPGGGQFISTSSGGQHSARSRSAGTNRSRASSNAVQEGTINNPITVGEDGTYHCVINHDDVLALQDAHTMTTIILKGDAAGGLDPETTKQLQVKAQEVQPVLLRV